MSCIVYQLEIPTKKDIENYFKHCRYVQVIIKTYGGLILNFKYDTCIIAIDILTYTKLQYIDFQLYLNYVCHLYQINCIFNCQS